MTWFLMAFSVTMIFLVGISLASYGGVTPVVTGDLLRAIIDVTGVLIGFGGVVMVFSISSVRENIRHYRDHEANRPSMQVDPRQVELRNEIRKWENRQEAILGSSVSFLFACILSWAISFVTWSVLDGVSGKQFLGIPVAVFLVSAALSFLGIALPFLIRIIFFDRP